MDGNSGGSSRPPPVNTVSQTHSLWLEAFQPLRSGSLTSGQRSGTHSSILTEFVLQYA